MSKISELMLRIGEAEAQGIANRGQLWGGAIQQLGQLPLSIAQMRQAAAAQDVERRKTEAETDLARARAGSEVAGQAKIGHDLAVSEEDRAIQQKIQPTVDWLVEVGRLTGPEAADAYQQGRTRLIEAGIIDPTMYPAQYSPSLIKSRLQSKALEHYKVLYPEPKVAPSGSGILVGQDIVGQVPFKEEPEPTVSVQTMEDGKRVTKVLPRSEAAGKSFPSQPRELAPIVIQTPSGSLPAGNPCLRIQRWMVWDWKPM